MIPLYHDPHFTFRFADDPWRYTAERKRELAARRLMGSCHGHRLDPQKQVG